MITRREKSLLKSGTSVCLVGSLAVGLLALCFADRLRAGPQTTSSVIAHEWGTFTAIAGADGRAVQWIPFVNPAELPAFVEHLSSPGFKFGLRGTIRMETPVLYFYSPREETLSVKVAFAKGLITEWYPHAVRVQPAAVQPDVDLNHLPSDGSITWSNVAVAPNLTVKFPRDSGQTRYYAARETASAPLRVKTAAGDEVEKFLFYRGVSAAPLPISAKQSSDGKLVIKSLSEARIPAAILFERRGERVGYQVQQAEADEMAFDSPSLTDSLDSLYAQLEAILVNQGLYVDEAHAMVETWKDSWFEEGSRLIYIVPRGFIDNILPLTMNPVPEQFVRVFVGRLEIVTPATARAVEAAIAAKDEATLNKYERFLEPILQVTHTQHSISNR
jgi:hypothetical protein